MNEIGFTENIFLGWMEPPFTSCGSGQFYYRKKAEHRQQLAIGTDGNKAAKEAMNLSGIQTILLLRGIYTCLRV
jgi:hypothetical protein